MSLLAELLILSGLSCIMLAIGLTFIRKLILLQYGYPLKGLMYIFGSSGKCVGTIGVSDDREKSFGAPEAQISPQQPKFEPLPKRFFSPSHSKDLIYQVHLRINRMNHIFFWIDARQLSEIAKNEISK